MSIEDMIKTQAKEAARQASYNLPGMDEHAIDMVEEAYIKGANDWIGVDLNSRASVYGLDLTDTKTLADLCLRYRNEDDLTQHLMQWLCHEDDARYLAKAMYLWHVREYDEIIDCVMLPLWENSEKRTKNMCIDATAEVKDNHDPKTFVPSDDFIDEMVAKYVDYSFDEGDFHLRYELMNKHGFKFNDARMIARCMLDVLNHAGCDLYRIVRDMWKSASEESRPRNSTTNIQVTINDPYPPMKNTDEYFEVMRARIEADKEKNAQ